MLVEARGEIFTIPEEKGDVRNITNSSGSAERQPAWSPDGKWISYFSDKSGEYKLVIESQDGVGAPREIAFQKASFYYTPVWSPDSKKLLYTDTNLNVWVMDIATGQAKIVGNDPWMVPQRTLAPSWSPDSKWVAFASRLNTLYRAIVVANVETGEKRQITDGLADAMYPVWDASGKYLWFLASTDFGLASQWLDMTSYGREETFALYLAVLNKTDASPLLPESDEDPGIGARADREHEQAARPAPPVRCTIDFDRLQQRILPVPGVPSRQYSPAEGRRGRHGVLPRGAARRQRARQHAASLPAERSQGRSSSRPTSPTTPSAPTARSWCIARAPPQGGGAAADAHAGTASRCSSSMPTRRRRRRGRAGIDVTLRMHLDPKAEFTQIFNEGWRLQRDYLYVPNMQGANWPRMKEMYGAMLPHVAHRADLNYLLDNMGAEIAIGHSYVRGGAMPEVPANPGGLLGADFAIEGGRYKIAKIYDGESWNPDLRAPLAGPGINVVGRRLHPRDQRRQPRGARQHLPPARGHGEPPDRPDDQQRAGHAGRAAGHGRAGCQRSEPAHARVGRRESPLRRQAIERPARVRLRAEHRAGRLRQLQPLLLRAAGQAGRGDRRALQRRRLGGRLHHRRAAARLRRLLQQRRRRSSSVHQSVGRHLGTEGDDHQRDGGFGRRPDAVDVPLSQDRPARRQAHVGRPGPHRRHAAVHRWRLDDCASRRLLHREGKWAVENEGTAPDIDVENWPKDVIAGRDPQLERAVDEALRLLKEKPVDRLTTEPAPPTWGKRPGGN